MRSIQYSMYNVNNILSWWLIYQTDWKEVPWLPVDSKFTSLHSFAFHCALHCSQFTIWLCYFACFCISYSGGVPCYLIDLNQSQSACAPLLCSANGQLIYSSKARKNGICYSFLIQKMTFALLHSIPKRILECNIRFGVHTSDFLHISTRKKSSQIDIYYFKEKHVQLVEFLFLIGYRRNKYAYDVVCIQSICFVFLFTLLSLSFKHMESECSGRSFFCSFTCNRHERWAHGCDSHKAFSVQCWKNTY